MTKYYDWKDQIKETELEECITILKENGTVVMPTETVYGIGANALSDLAAQKIYQAKGREQDNPLIVHVSDREMLEKIVIEIDEVEEKLIEKFMPGPFTLILKKKKSIPDTVSAKLPTIGVRMPNHPIAHTLIKKAEIPIAAPSANISGRPSGTRLSDIKEELEGRVDAFIDGGISNIGLESTVVKVIDGVPTILRPGAITAEMIKETVGCVAINQKVLEKVEKGEKVESPGMKYRHYAPTTPCVCVYSKDPEKQIEKIRQLIKEKGKEHVCVLGFEENKNKVQAKEYLTLGKREDLESISKNIFTFLRKADKLGVDLIIIEGVPKKGMGLAIMNRLVRTCEYHVYNLEEE